MQSLREDKLKQDIVFKLVPQIFKGKFSLLIIITKKLTFRYVPDEMQRRRDYYAQKGGDPKSNEDAGITSPDTNYFRPTDKISMSLEYDNG